MIATVARRSARRVVRRGPKIRLVDATVQARLLEAIRGGSPLGQAAVYAGVAERTLYRTLARGDEADARAEDGEQLDPDDEACRELLTKVKEARAAVAVRNVALLQKAAQGGYVLEETTRVYTDESGRQVRETTTKQAPPEWRAALALLERSFPRDFGRGAQQLEVITPPPDADGAPGRPGAGGGPSLEVVRALSTRLAAHTAQAAADEDVQDAELVDDDDSGAVFG